ncbi:hypothetical protein Athai_04020 [Actinocatenispora thailandica]|uniref:F420-dependent oxidoreductase n=1 Tax=Actinocatenispora thailandica TaxID=227318 RepID=A0A7R7HVH9_9ACTN|nr:Pr6Pr family membrane protein [Actinocatenispora thailandica]BCJ32899.1 hypothetical protein Athai_04020 [Actinocatenispora thailandica]
MGTELALRRAGRAWHGALAVLLTAALVAQVVLVCTGGDGDTEVSVTARLVRTFSFFTIQSNLLVLADCLVRAVRPDADGTLRRVLRLDALLGITVTGLVFALVLAGDSHPTGLAWWLNLMFHYAAPPIAVVGWLLFGPRRRIDPGSLGLALIWPLLWIGYTLGHGAVSGWYPYPFLTVTDLGYPVALRNLAFVVILGLVLLAAFAGLDRLLARSRWTGGTAVAEPAAALPEPDTAGD